MPGQDCPKSKRKHTPITTEVQRGAMGAAYAAKKGEIPYSKLRRAARGIAKSMSKAELERHLEESKGKDLPAKRALHRRFGKKR